MLLYFYKLVNLFHSIESYRNFEIFKHKTCKQHNLNSYFKQFYAHHGVIWRKRNRFVTCSSWLAYIGYAFTFTTFAFNPVEFYFTSVIT